MFRWTKFIAPVAGLALLLSFNQAQSRADDAMPATTGKATITVTVVDKDGKPVADATVDLLPPTAGKKKKKGGDVPPATSQPSDTGGKPPKPTPIATATTGADGTATLTKIADGDYMVGVRMKGVGNGREKVTVADDKDTTVSVTLKPRQKKNAN